MAGARDDLLQELDAVALVEPDELDEAGRVDVRARLLDELGYDPDDVELEGADLS
jgi:hypothetical protein